MCRGPRPRPVPSSPTKMQPSSPRLRLRPGEPRGHSRAATLLQRDPSASAPPAPNVPLAQATFHAITAAAAPPAAAAQLPMSATTTSATTRSLDVYTLEMISANVAETTAILAAALNRGGSGLRRVGLEEEVRIRKHIATQMSREHQLQHQLQQPSATALTTLLATNNATANTAATRADVSRSLFKDSIAAPSVHAVNSTSLRDVRSSHERPPTRPTTTTRAFGFDSPLQSPNFATAAAAFTATHRSHSDPLRVNTEAASASPSPQRPDPLPQPKRHAGRNASTTTRGTLHHHPTAHARPLPPRVVHVKDQGAQTPPQQPARSTLEQDLSDLLGSGGTPEVTRAEVANAAARATPANNGLLHSPNDQQQRARGGARATAATPPVNPWTRGAKPPATSTHYKSTPRALVDLPPPPSPTGTPTESQPTTPLLRDDEVWLYQTV
jgi:hypothetical protein